MKTLTLALLIILPCFALMAQYKPVNKKSTVQFTIGNFGFDVKGSFTGIQGLINFDAANPANGNMDITVDAGTINTDNSRRDKHLKDESYFDVKNYPNIHFVSAKITTFAKTGNYIVFGKLTIKGKSKDISIPFSVTPVNDEFLFKGTFKINRKDFGVGGTSTISNELEVTLNIQAAKV
jgi:polyisoprenoid-binding protein YceI